MKHFHVTIIALILAVSGEMAFAVQPVNIDRSNVSEPSVLRQGLPERRLSGSSR